MSLSSPIGIGLIVAVVIATLYFVLFVGILLLFVA
jgi:hypothetical protein